MLCPLKLVLVPVLLDYSLGLKDLIASSLELTAHVGNAALMGCVFQSTEDKRVTKVDWVFSPGEHAKEEYVLYYYANLSVPVGRFQSRVHLVGDISRSDGSLLLRDVAEADQGTYTCEIRLERESLVVKKAVVLHVLPAEPRELLVGVGESVQVGCVLPSTEEKRVTKVDWTFSPGERAQEESVLHCSPRLCVPPGYPQAWGRFQNRVSPVGNTARNDGSIVLQGVRESDGGSYTCHLHLGSLTLRKTVVLRVNQNKAQAQVTPVAHAPEILGGNQLVIIVGIVCLTILLLPVLILIVKRMHSPASPAALVKSLEDPAKAQPEKHVYSSITTREVAEEKESWDKSEPTYMTMHPVWPPLTAAPDDALETPSAGGVLATAPAL